MKRSQILLSAGIAAILLLGAWAGAARRPQAASSSSSSSSPSSSTNSPGASPQKQDSMKDMPGMQNMPGMDMSHAGDSGKSAGDESDAEKDPHAQGQAMHAMQMGPGHHMHMTGPHMRMTALRQASPEDWARADQIAATLRTSIEKYKDYRIALADGYRIFAPNVPQPEYHFTNYENGFLESFTFNPARPTSLLYRKTKDGGWELIGAMYTAPRAATLAQLDERVPLGIAQWHVHTNLCLPPRAPAGQTAKVDWTKFGLEGSIATEKTCTAAGGRFYPQIFGWMVHVYPFESSRALIWGQ